MKIMVKLLIILLVISLVPLGYMGYVGLKNLSQLGSESVSNLNELKVMSIEDSSSALTQLGEYMIKKVAVEQAKQLEVYIKANPDMTTKDLQADKYFSELALHANSEYTEFIPYTPIATTKAPIYARFHPAPHIVDIRMDTLKEKLPVWFDIMNSTVEPDKSKTKFGIHCKDSEGYYDWEEADGSIREKYMYVACVNATTADGEQYTVSAATYVDQFTSPVIATTEKIEARTNTVLENINEKIETIRAENLVILIVTLIFVVIAGVVFALSITKPIQEMTRAGNEIANGNLNIEIPEIKSKDEIRELSVAMNLLVGALKFLKKEKKEK